MHIMYERLNSIIHNFPPSLFRAYLLKIHKDLAFHINN